MQIKYILSRGYNSKRVIFHEKIYLSCKQGFFGELGKGGGSVEREKKPDEI